MNAYLGRMLLLGLITFLLGSPQSLRADDGGTIVVNNPPDGSGGQPVQGGSGTPGFNTIPPGPTYDGIAFEPPTYFTTGTTVEPGSTLEMNIILASSEPSTDEIHSFSFTFANSTTDLDFQSLTASLPPGWTFTTTENSFSAENVDGNDFALTTSPLTIGTISYTVSTNTSLGTVLDVPTPLTESFTDTQGNSIPSAGFTGLQVDVVPEPSSSYLFLSALALFIPFHRRMLPSRSALDL